MFKTKAHLSVWGTFQASLGAISFIPLELTSFLLFRKECQKNSCH